MKKLTYAEAINEALFEAMEEFPELFILGEDICRPEGKDGAFHVTAGLSTRFSDRVKNTILNESVIVSLGLGTTFGGGRAVCEMQFADFVTDAVKPIGNYAAGLYYRHAITSSLVIRLPSGEIGSAGPFHSTCPEMLFWGKPGLVILAPATPYDAKGLLKTAIRGQTPTLFLEWKKLYAKPPENYPPELNLEIPDEDYAIQIGKARFLREGNDITIVSYGNMLFEALRAADVLKEKGLSAEIIDLRSLMPLDFETIANSLKKTNRIIVAHEDKAVGGFGGVLIQLLLREGLFDWMDAEPLVVGASFTPHPHNPILEKEYLPNADDIVRTAEKISAGKIFAAPSLAPEFKTIESATPKPTASAESQTANTMPIPESQKIIAERMAEQWQRPCPDSDIQIDFRNIGIEIELRKNKFLQQAGVKLTYTPFIAYAISRILTQEKFQKFRAYFEETKKANGEFDWAHPGNLNGRDFVNISIAVALESDDPKKDDRLLVPVIKNAHTLTFSETAKEISTLAEKCRNGKLLPDEQEGGVITITNIGMFGVMRGSPILTDSKQMSSVAVGQIQKYKGQTQIMGTVTLRFDHRMINGALAGRFLQALKEYLENWNIDIFNQ